MADQAYPCTCHVEETCVVHGTPPDSQSPASYQPPMNWQERARRAEMLAERLAESVSFSLLPADCGLDFISVDALRKEAQANLDAWHQHQADLQTLAQAQQECR